ncbi:histidinol phosphatase [Agromyces archimandritae]|uniref:Histidinol phosphatase n=2 Tax=Agromyces archimandritae TaxID=2781962 RepID=A0A975IQ67_9MICO|nr:histidinol phosphatase [Agromyces archimandritae]
MRHFRDAGLDIRTKPDRSPVTEADLAVERAIRERIAETRPADGVFGEEFGIAGSASRQWIIDPIDGTANFLRGVPVWATLVSLAIEGVPVVGVVSAPAMRRRWWASRAAGAWTVESAAEAGASGSGADAAGEAAERPAVPGARRLRVSGVERLEDASLSFQSLAQWRDAGYLDRLLALSERVWRDRAYGDMWSYMLLAEGLIDITGEFDVKPYDLAALIPIVEEAGGRFSSIDGVPGPWEGSSLATNGLLHDTVLEALVDPEI